MWGRQGERPRRLAHPRPLAVPSVGGAPEPARCGLVRTLRGHLFVPGLTRAPSVAGRARLPGGRGAHLPAEQTIWTTAGSTAAPGTCRGHARWRDVGRRGRCTRTERLHS